MHVYAEVDLNYKSIFHAVLGFLGFFLQVKILGEKEGNKL